MEADDPGLDCVVFAIVGAQSLGDELLPPIGVLRLRRIGVFLLKRHNACFGLLVFGINACRRAVQIAAYAVAMRRLQGLKVDHRVVVEDLRVMGGDETHPAHIRGERIDLVDVACRYDAVLPDAKIQEQEFVAIRRTEFRLLDVHAADPVSVAFETAGEMAPDEATHARNKNSCGHSVTKSYFSSRCVN